MANNNDTKKRFSRRAFPRTGTVTPSALAVSDLNGILGAAAAENKKAQGFFTKDISPRGLVRIYSRINETVTGKVAIKIHTGEPHGPNILPRNIVQALLICDSMASLKEKKMGSDSYEPITV